MTAPANVFPDYPVAAFEGREPDYELATIETQPIIKATTIAEAYLAALRGGGETASNVVPVKGEFGSGKTHLLGHVATRVRLAPRSSVVTVATMETDPVDWYRSAVGPALERLPLAELVSGAYAEAAKTVAGRAPLTAAAVDQIAADPEIAKALVQRQLLNPTAVDGAFQELLERTCSGMSSDVVKALSQLVWEPRAPLRWLGGDELSEREQASAGLTRAIASDHAAADAIAAVAALHSRLGRPFALLIDELEHLARFDESTGTKRNITWMKRLLERLARTHVLVFVAGHTSVWTGQRDYLDRFSPTTAIELHPLKAQDVHTVALWFTGNVGTFGEEHAARVAEISEGNMRRVLTILKGLFTVSDGFRLPITDAAIVDVAQAVSRKIDPETALERLETMLTSAFGLRVRRETAVVPGIVFDLVAYDGGDPVVVVELKHATFAQRQHEQAQRFIDRIRVIAERAPRCIGCFIAEGSLDDALLSVVQPDAGHVFWFDLTRDDVVSQVRSMLEVELPRRAGAAGNGDEAAERDAALRGVLEEIQTIKHEQASAYEDLRVRLAEQRSVDDGRLSVRVPEEDEFRERRRKLYEELSAPPTIWRRLALLFDIRSIGFVSILAIGIFLLAAAGTLLDALDLRKSAWNAFFNGFGALFVSLAVLQIGRVLLAIERFYTFKRETLRDVYVRDLPLDALIDVNRTLERCLDRYGPARGMFEAQGMLDSGEVGRYD